MSFLREAELEQVFLEDLERLGFARHHGSTVAPDLPSALRASYRDTILAPVLREALTRLNPDLPETAIAEAQTRIEDVVFATDLLQENRRLHDLMVNGIPLTYFADGEERNAQVNVIDWDDTGNDWRAMNQVDVVGKTPRVPDVILFLNGLPLVVIELKGIDGADLTAAFRQIETYKEDIPDLFKTTLLSVISDDVTARYGSLSAGYDRFMRWRTVDGETLASKGAALELENLTNGLLNRRTLLDMLRWFVVFEDEGKGAIKPDVAPMN